MCKGREFLGAHTERWGFQLPHLSAGLFVVPFPSLWDPGDGARRFVRLLSLCIVISPPCFLQLVLDVILIQLFVVTNHKFFGKVLQEIKKKPVKKGDTCPSSWIKKCYPSSMAVWAVCPYLLLISRKLWMRHKTSDGKIWDLTWSNFMVMFLLLLLPAARPNLALYNNSF